MNEWVWRGDSAVGTGVGRRRGDFLGETLQSVVVEVPRRANGAWLRMTGLGGWLGEETTPGTDRLGRRFLHEQEKCKCRAVRGEKRWLATALQKMQGCQRECSRAVICERVRGSSQSRQASPRRLKARTASITASAGKITM
jgi:hypothetical protein